MAVFYYDTMVYRYIAYFLLVLSAISCTMTGRSSGAAEGNACAAFFELLPGAVVTVSPFTGQRDTLKTDRPFDNIVCMSTSHVAFLSEIGSASAVRGVSGVRFLSDSTVRENPDVVETGYEAAFDFEAVMALKPDVVLAYTVSSVEPPYLSRLRSLGVRVFILYDHLEHHPLARAEYVRLAGALTGRQELADSVFNDVSEKYLSLAASVSGTAANGSREAVRVLLNLPYSDMWYIPGAENYMSYLIRDAGGIVLGARPGRSESSVISLEKAYGLSRDADFWLNTGSCTTRSQIETAHPLFSRFGPMRSPHSVFNNVARVNEAGGNDFWESGAVHPELILSDLISIFGGTAQDGTLHYYIEVE